MKFTASDVDLLLAEEEGGQHIPTNATMNMSLGFEYLCMTALGSRCDSSGNTYENYSGRIESGSVNGFKGIENDFPDYPGSDSTISPGEGWEWRGNDLGSEYGAWYNPGTGESLHPDFDHTGQIGPHWDYISPDGTQYRMFPDGMVVPK